MGSPKIVNLNQFSPMLYSDASKSKYANMMPSPPMLSPLYIGNEKGQSVEFPPIDTSNPDSNQ